MSGQSQVGRTVVAIFASLLMSTVAIGAAVGPAESGSAPVEASTYA